MMREEREIETEKVELLQIYIDSKCSSALMVNESGGGSYRQSADAVYSKPKIFLIGVPLY